jgi:hypothetical protein
MRRKDIDVMKAGHLIVLLKLYSDDDEIEAKKFRTY